jgi:hypothetical protein
MNRFHQFFFCLLVLAFSACTFNSAGLNAQTDDCASMECGHGICVKLPGEPAECQCESNWQGVDCSECVTGYTGADCSECADGYEKNDVELCVPIVVSPCEPNPCVHGTCVDLGEQSIRCECETGYAGLLCGDCAQGYELNEDDECVPIVIDPCSLLDCGAHGTCVVNQQSQSATCNCEAGYLGDLCEQCDELNGYEMIGGACQLDPCFEKNCGAGTCLRDDQTWTATCDCIPEAFGDSCQYWYENSLIYQESEVRLRIQVKDPLWLDSTSTIRVNQTGTVSGVGTIYYNQSDLFAGGWLGFRPCLPGLDEEISFYIMKSPYGATERMKIEYLPPLNPVDPHGFIYDVSTTLDQDVFRVQCYDCATGCKARPAGGPP